MPTEFYSFAKRYRRLLCILNLWVIFAPGRWRPAFIFAIGRCMNPFQIQGEKVRRSIGLALPECQTKHTWRGWLDSHVRFVLDFLDYTSFDAAWLKRNVFVVDPTLLESLRDSGGLLLTYHTHHQNTLCCALGLAGIKISPIAALPEHSPLFPFIGRWAQRLNSDSEAHFRGGKYLFTDNLRNLLQSTRKAFAEQDVVLCLCDFHHRTDLCCRQPDGGVGRGRDYRRGL